MKILKNRNNEFNYLGLLFGIVLIVLYAFSFSHYLLFHVSAEFISIVIAVSVFLVTYLGRKYIRSNYLIILGFAYLFIAFLDFIHTLGYKGMNIFYNYDYYANQLWIAARFFESVVILVSLLSIKWKSKVNIHILFFTYTIITGFFIVSIFFTDIFPVCFVEGVGQTSFKIISEYVIMGILFVSFYLTYKNRKYLNKEIAKYLMLSIGFTILSEFLFTLYMDNYGVINMLGHYMKIFSFFYIYKAVIVKSIEEPYDTIFRELNRMKNILGLENKVLEQRVHFDGLTGVYNHAYIIDRIKEEVQRYRRYEKQFLVAFLDVDEFKQVNDTYGHLVGDKVLMDLAILLKKNFRESDFIGRYGGDEFIVLLLETEKKQGCELATRLIESVRETKLGELSHVTISVGLAAYEGENFEVFMEKVDKLLYQAKAAGKNQVNYTD